MTYTFLPLLYLFDMGQFDKALALLNKAIALVPESYSHKVLKVIIYRNLGDLEAAQENRDELAGFGAEEWRLGFLDVRINFGNENPADTLESINRLLPTMQHTTSIARSMAGANGR
jgi:tetratricopeptide (TPR) repeat protein